MNPISHFPSEVQEKIPRSQLGIHAVAIDEAGVYAVYLYEPNTNPVKAYEHRVRQGRITEQIDDLQIDRHAREAIRVNEDFLGSYDELKTLINRAIQAMREKEYMTFEDALVFVKTGEIRSSVMTTLNM